MTEDSITNKPNEKQGLFNPQRWGLPLIAIIGLADRLVYDCAACRVWTVTEKGRVREEWLLVRRESDGDFSFSLSNAPMDTSLSQLAYWRLKNDFHFYYW